MWLLECEAAVLQGKRLWLRPGTRKVFGRVPDDAEPDRIVVVDKSISRKHLAINVANVEPGDVTDVGTRSQVTIEDLGTKIGTLHNGVSIKGKCVVLQGDTHEIMLARYPHPFRITWQPVVLTLSFTSKELRAKPILERLEPLDVKCLTEYARQSTTHVLSKKRNTSKGLQALVNGKYIVQQDSFLDAILTVTEREPGPDSKSQLETDFDGFWPNALDYLPAQGAEPTQLPATAYAPDLARQTIFEGYSFVFCEEGQYNQLLAPITDGGGKAFLKKANPDITTVEDFVDDFVRYVKGIAGEKGLGEFEDGSEGKGVVVVRFVASKGPSIEWFADFITQMSQLLDHRPIEQSEFLDAILRNDASVLRRPLEPALSGVVSSSFAASSTLQQNLAVDISEIPPQKTAKPRRIITSRFKGFDDIDLSDESEINSVQRTQAVNNPASIGQESQESGMFMSQRDESVIESQPAFSQAPTQKSSSRKRPASEELSVMDQLAPAALGLKRRRLEEQAARRERGEPSPPPAAREKLKPEITQSKTKTKTKKPEKQIDVLEIARQRREKEAALAEADRAALEASLENIDINEVRNLIMVEEMEVRSIIPAPRPEHAHDSERWQDKWNGRKNFKKFRRRGQVGIGRPPPKVIVELEEVKKKDYGIGDAYWHGSDGDGKRERKGKGKGKASSSQSTPRIKNEDWDDDDAMEMSDAPPPVSAASQRTSTMRSQGSQKLADKTNTTRTSQAQNKRPATEPLKNPAPAKRARPMLEVENSDESDESDDGTKFKFRRGRR